MSYTCLEFEITMTMGTYFLKSKICKLIDMWPSNMGVWHCVTRCDNFFNLSIVTIKRPFCVTLCHILKWSIWSQWTNWRSFFLSHMSHVKLSTNLNLFKKTVKYYESKFILDSFIFRVSPTRFLRHLATIINIFPRSRVYSCH